MCYQRCRYEDYNGECTLKRDVIPPIDAMCIINDTDAENVMLRELVRDMYGFIKRMDEECGDVTFSSCFDYCKHNTAGDGCCKTGECWYDRRMRELGIEVTS